MGPDDATNGWRLDGSTTELVIPAYDATASPTFLNLLGSTSYDPQTVNFVLNYSDGTSENWTQSLSDWWNGSGQQGEVLNVALDHRIDFDGSSIAMDAGETLNLFSYHYPLPSGKSLTSIAFGQKSQPNFSYGKNHAFRQ